MNLYQVQLETRDKIYSYEVWTSDHDAVDRARNHLAGLIGSDQAALAHKGGYAKIGHQPGRSRAEVKLEKVTG
jgi:uncharacterized protein YjaZ